MSNPTRAGQRSSALIELDTAVARFRRLFQLPNVRAFIEGRLGDRVGPQHFRVLRAIEDVEDRDPGVGEVAALLELDVSTVSRMLDKAIEAGLVDSARSRLDGRRRVLALTPAGREVLDEVTLVRLELWTELAQGIDAADLATAADVFGRLRENATRLGT